MDKASDPGTEKSNDDISEPSVQEASVTDTSSPKVALESLSDDGQKSVENSTVPLVAPPLPVVPQPAPTQADDTQTQNSPMTLVLQWLTYAFWGWFALAIMWLVLTTIGFMVTNASGQSDWSLMIAYPISATIVLFLVSSVVDLFYSRVEPARKQGVATAIMVIHVVIFALCGIGWLISALFSLITLGLSSGVGDTVQTTQTVLYTSFVMIVVYMLLLIRTLLVAKIRRIAIIITAIFAALALLFVILGVVGPVAQSFTTRQDREIEHAIAYVPNAMQDYVSENGELPSSLSKLKVTNYSSQTADEVQKTLSKDLIRYTPNVKPSKTGDEYGSLSSSDGVSLKKTDYSTGSLSKTYYYKLCVTWTAEKGNSERTVPYPADDVDSEDVYNSYINVYSHNKGEQCYDMKAVSRSKK